MVRTDIPDIVIGRLPLYLRALNRLQQENLAFTSSHVLGQRLGISSAQIRKDLSLFGEFGKQGTGYHISTLIAELQRILHTDCEWQVALIGVGDLGRALAHYKGFVNRGFRITHLFDNDPAKIGQRIGEFEVLDAAVMEKTIREACIKVAMLSTPGDEAQDVADILVQAGIQAILNYAPITLLVPDGICVQYIDPVIHLQRMVYYLDLPV
ncbi:MAG: redox-sensing transcriptional repressor Rex [Anaerolineae bacterium]|nr:redox-sensing transcriptional repressor Rex [Anaerolineae bacterium]